MLKKSLLASALIAITMVSIAPIANAEPRLSTRQLLQKERQDQANKAIAVAFFTQAFVEQKPREAFNRYINPNKYIQHNPNVGDGRDTALPMIESFQNPANKTTIHKVLADGDLVMIHYKLEMPNGMKMAIMDMFRLENGLIVEHWDLMQVFPESTPNNPHPFF